MEPREQTKTNQANQHRVPYEIRTHIVDRIVAISRVGRHTTDLNSDHATQNLPLGMSPMAACQAEARHSVETQAYPEDPIDAMRTS